MEFALLNGCLQVLQELSSLTEVPTVNGAQRGGSLDLLRDPSQRKALAICSTCSLVQQCSGINNAFNFSSTFLSANGISPATVTLIAVLMNVGNVGVTVISAGLMDTRGRKPLLIGSAVGMTVSIIALTASLVNPGESWTSPAAVLAVVGFVTCFGVGMGPVPWLLPAELFPGEAAAHGSAISATVNWLSNWVVGQSFLPLSLALGGFCFVPSAVMLICFVVWALVSLPETRGKSVEQILAELKN